MPIYSTGSVGWAFESVKGILVEETLHKTYKKSKHTNEESTVILTCKQNIFVCFSKRKKQKRLHVFDACSKGCNTIQR